MIIPKIGENISNLLDVISGKILKFLKVFESTLKVLSNLISVNKFHFPQSKQSHGTMLCSTKVQREILYVTFILEEFEPITFNT